LESHESASNRSHPSNSHAVNACIFTTASSIRLPDMVPRHRGIDPYVDISAAGAQCIATSRRQCLFLNRQLNNWCVESAFTFTNCNTQGDTFCNWGQLWALFWLFIELWQQNTRFLPRIDRHYRRTHKEIKHISTTWYDERFNYV